MQQSFDEKLPLISWCVYSFLLFFPICFSCLNILNRNDLCCSLSMNFDFTGSAHLLTWKRFIYSFPVLVGILIGLDDVWTSWAAADLSIWLAKDCFTLSIEDLTFILLWTSCVMWSSNSSILLNVWEHWVSLQKVIVQSWQSFPLFVHGSRFYVHCIYLKLSNGLSTSTLDSYKQF